TPTVEDVEAATHGEAISFEFLRDANPDWLIVLDRAAAIGSGEQNARATLDNELAAETTAWKKGQVVYMPAADFYIAAGGVQSTMRVLEAIRDAFSQTK
ncbi:MAG: iron ABC transporter substrate-binding protein, partial [Mesorhizobium sp.]